MSPALAGRFFITEPPGKSSTLLITAAAAAAKLLQSCLTLCSPIDGSPPGSSVPGILQARILSGLPFPYPMHACKQSRFSHVRLCATPWTAAPRLLCLETCKPKQQRNTTSYLLVWLSSKSLHIINVSEDVEKRDPLYTVGGNVNWRNHSGKQYRVLSIELPYDPVYIFRKNENTNLKSCIQPSAYSSTVYSIQDTGAT